MQSDVSNYKRLEVINDPAILKKQLKILLIQAVHSHAHDAEAASRTAYELAGLLALDLVRQFDDADPYIQVLELAAQLELPERHQKAEASWWRLAQLVRDLPG